MQPNLDIAHLLVAYTDSCQNLLLVNKSWSRVINQIVPAYIKQLQKYCLDCDGGGMINKKCVTGRCRYYHDKTCPECQDRPSNWLECSKCVGTGVKVPYFPYYYGTTSTAQSYSS